MPFGSGGWGSSSWGDGGSEVALNVPSVVAIRENVVRVTFDFVPYYSGALDTKDASDVTKYAIATVSSTGLDGSPAWDVTITRVDAVFGDDKSVDLILDRAMCPWPARYTVTVSDVWEASKTNKMYSAISATFYALHQAIVPPTIVQGPRGVDFASPNTYQGALDPVSSPQDIRNLGTFPTNDRGDYAEDEGIQSLKKRILRRLFTRKGGFAHLPEYGVGIATYGKKLGSTATRAQIAAEAERQIGSEPEMSKVVVRSTPTVSGVFRIDVLAQLKDNTQAKVSATIT